jgi:hypothetical protein
MDEAWLTGGFAANDSASAEPWAETAPAGAASEFEWPGGPTYPEAASPLNGAHANGNGHGVWPNGHGNHIGEPVAAAVSGEFDRWPLTNGPEE